MGGNRQRPRSRRRRRQSGFCARSWGSPGMSWLKCGSGGLERPHVHESAALELRSAIGGIEPGQCLDFGAEWLRTVARVEAEVRGLGVVPPLVAVRGHAVDDGVAEPGCEE